MSRFVRQSKFRHVYGQPAKRSESFDNVRPSRNANDSNVVKANPLYVAVCWEASGGGAFAVLNQKTDVGKLPAQPNLFTGHKAAVLDIDFHPFNDHIIASASEDTKVNVWQIPTVIEAPQVRPVRLRCSPLFSCREAARSQPRPWRGAATSPRQPGLCACVFLGGLHPAPPSPPLRPRPP